MNTSNPFSISPAGLSLIKRHESCRLRAYLCPANRLTIGYGHVILPKFDAARFGLKADQVARMIAESQTAKRITSEAGRALVIRQAVADALLDRDTSQVALFLRSTAQLITLNQNQFDALASFIFNVGQGNYATSTLRKRLLAGDYAGVAAEFGRWIYGPDGPDADHDKDVLPGLVERRAEERDLFLLS